MVGCRNEHKLQYAYDDFELGNTGIFQSFVESEMIETIKFNTFYMCYDFHVAHMDKC